MVALIGSLNWWRMGLGFPFILYKNRFKSHHRSKPQTTAYLCLYCMCMCQSRGIPEECGFVVSLRNQPNKAGLNHIRAWTIFIGNQTAWTWDLSKFAQEVSFPLKVVPCGCSFTHRKCLTSHGFPVKVAGYPTAGDFSNGKHENCGLFLLQPGISPKWTLDTCFEVDLQSSGAFST